MQSKSGSECGERPRSNRPRRPAPEMVIAYLKYAVDDVRALSPRGTSLLESAIAALVEDNRASSTERTSQ